jgi:electron transport complex protein RnfB
MNGEEKIYHDLRIHLDQETIGFPSSPSGSDIRLLKQLFNPQQAEAASLLTYKFESLDQIANRAEKLGKSRDEIEKLLDESANKGVIGYKKKNGEKQYKNIPYLVGMAEAGMHNPTPEFIEAHRNYVSDSEFFKAFTSTVVPQMRTIPIEKSVTPQYITGSYDEVEKIIQATEGPIAILECVCRNGAERRGEPCQQTSRKETCMGFGYGAKNLIEAGKGRSILKDEALNILRQNQKEHLILQPSNSQDPDFICSCCGCCCGILRLHKAVPDPVSFWATNYYAKVDSNLCVGCGNCEESCQTGAIAVKEDNEISEVDLSHCLGCGICINECPNDAISLQKKEKLIIPPKDGEEMYEVIMTNKL